MKKTITMIPGRGIGPELCNSLEKVFNGVNVPLVFEKIENFDI